VENRGLSWCIGGQGKFEAKFLGKKLKIIFQELGEII
jgi:hypothetical protein